MSKALSVLLLVNIHMNYLLVVFGAQGRKVLLWM